MTTNQRNFDDWYAKVLRELISREETGFVLLCAALPLLERYLREKSGAHEATSLPDKFFDELRAFFPVLADNSVAKDFWGAYRHGLLHQVTMALATTGGFARRAAKIAWDGKDAVELRSSEFFVHPGKFTERVLTIIESDFTTFEGPGSPAHPFPTIDGSTNSTSSFATPIVGPTS